MAHRLGLRAATTAAATVFLVVGLLGPGRGLARADSQAHPPDRERFAASKHPRLDSSLTKLLRVAASSNVEPLPTHPDLRAEWEPVHVVVQSHDADAVEQGLRVRGATDVVRYLDVVQAWVSPALLNELSEWPFVRFVEAAERPDRAVVSQGISVIGAAAWQTNGLHGSGVRIAVIDSGFANYAARQTAGELPTNLIVQNYCGSEIGSNVHGTAAAEIIYDIVPQAQLYLVCVSTRVDLGLAKDFARSNGVHIVSMSLSWPATSRGDSTGAASTPEGIVADARNAGLLWVNSAGNHALRHWSGVFTDANLDGWHEFVPSSATNVVRIPTDREVCVWLKWDAWPVTSVDYDLYLYRQSDLSLGINVLPVEASENLQSGSQPPREHLCYTNLGPTADFAIAIAGPASGPTPRLDLYSSSADLRYSVTRTSILEPATSAAALAVGAVCWSSTTIEPYSSQGPTIDGRVKPDISAPTSVSTVSYGSSFGCTSGFAGTSAAAPHVAGAAALVKQANPTFGPSQIQAFLESRARDLGVAGRDNTFGAGLLSLGPAAAGPLPTPTPTPLATSGAATARAVLPTAAEVGPGFAVQREKDWTFTEKAALLPAQPPYRTGAEMLQAWGWQAASEREFYRSVTSGVYSVLTIANVYSSPTGAATAYAHNLTQVAAVTGTPYTTSMVGAGLGDQSAGYARDLLATSTTGTQVPISELLLLFRSGSVSNSIYVYSFRGEMDTALATRLARLQASRSSTLLPSATPTPSPAASSIGITSTSSSYVVGTTALVVAALTGFSPSAGQQVTFIVDAQGSGPNADLTLTQATDSAGKAVVSYTRSSAGTDVITVYPTSVPSLRASLTLQWSLPTTLTGTTLYLPNITKTLGGPTGWQTPFIVQNVGDSATDLDVSFYSFGNGVLVASWRVPGLLPGRSFAHSPNDDPNLPHGSQFSVVIRSTASRIISVVNQHQGAGERAEALSYTGLSTGATRVFVPYVAKDVRGWLTTLVIQNLGTIPANVTVAFISIDGSRTATLTRVAAPGRSQFIDPRAEGSLVADTEYSATIMADQPVTALVNAHNDAPGVARPMGLSYGATTVPESAVAYVPYIARNTDGVARTSRVFVQNAGTADATPTISLQRFGGSAAITVAAPRPLRPGAAWVFDPRFSADGVTPCPATGNATCAGEGEWSAIVTGGRFAIANATTSTATALGYEGIAAATNKIFLPNTTRTLGGPSGWTTPIIIQSATATTATLRWYRFSDGVLVATQSILGLTSGASVRIDPRAVAGLSDDTQYAAVLESGGTLAALVTELDFSGGDGAMAYIGLAAQ